MVKSKSAYSIPGKKGKLDTHIIVVWVDNEAGVLARVVGLFSGRGYNIESLAVGEVDAKNNISRICKIVSGNNTKSLNYIHKVYSIVMKKIYKSKFCALVSAIFMPNICNTKNFSNYLIVLKRYNYKGFIPTAIYYISKC